MSGLLGFDHAHKGKRRCLPRRQRQMLPAPEQARDGVARQWAASKPLEVVLPVGLSRGTPWCGVGRGQDKGPLPHWYFSLLDVGNRDKPPRQSAAALPGGRGPRTALTAPPQRIGSRGPRHCQRRVGQPCRNELTLTVPARAGSKNRHSRDCRGLPPTQAQSLAPENR